MSGANKFVYWDTSIFLAYLNNETSHRPGEMSWVREKIQEFEIGNLNITTSVIAITEIMEISRLNEEQRNTLTNWFNRSNFRFIDANKTICEAHLKLIQLKKMVGCIIHSPLMLFMLLQLFTSSD